MTSSRVRLLAECCLIALGAGAVAFVLLTALHASLGTEAVQRFDLGVQAAVHSWGPDPRLLMLALTFIGSIEVFIPSLIVAVTVLLLIGEKERGRRLVRKREVAGLFTYGVVGAMFLNDSLKLHFHRARPKVPWSIGDEHTFSFPSGHSLFSLVLYGLIAYVVMNRRGRHGRKAVVLMFAALMTLGIGISRIYLGMHWPTDVIAGYLTGGAWLWASILIDRRWRTQRRSISGSV